MDASPETETVRGALVRGAARFLIALAATLALSACASISPGSPEQNTAGPADSAGLISPLDYEQIRTLIALYSHTFDARDVDAWAELFTEDAELITSAVGSPRGKAELRDWAAQRFAAREGVQMRHLSTNIVIVPVSADRVRARSYLLLTSQRPKGPADTQVLATGIYEDEILRTDQGWKFSRREAARSMPLRR